MNTYQKGFKCSCFLGNWNEVKKSKKTIAANHALIFTWMKSPALQSHPGHLWLLLLLKYSKRPALSGLCGNARCFPPRGAELLRPAFFSLFFFFFFFLNWLSVERKINNQILKEQHVKSTCISSQIPSTHGVLSVDKHSAVSGHIIFLFIFLTAYERSIHFPSHSPHKFLDKPVSALIVITTIEPCLANQVRLPKGHTYFMRHRIYLTKFFFYFSLLNWNHASYFIRHSESRRSVVRWAVCFIHVLWTSACPGVKNDQIPRGLLPDWL